MNYNDLTVTSLELWWVRDIIPQMALFQHISTIFRLVKLIILLLLYIYIHVNEGHLGGAVGVINEYNYASNLHQLACNPHPYNCMILYDCMVIYTYIYIT